MSFFESAGAPRIDFNSDRVARYEFTGKKISIVYKERGVDKTVVLEPGDIFAVRKGANGARMYVQKNQRIVIKPTPALLQRLYKNMRGS